AIFADSKVMNVGDALPAFTAHWQGLVGGDTPASFQPALTLTTTATSSSPVGSYPIVPGGAANPNYTIAFVPGNLTVRPVGTPSIILPADMTVEATQQGAAPGSFSVGLSDRGVGNAFSTDVCSPNPPGAFFIIGTTVETCTVTDVVGASATGSFRVTVRDSTPPLFDGVPPTVTVEADGPQGASV